MNEFGTGDDQTILPSATQLASRPDSRRYNWWRWFWIITLVVSLAYAWYCFYVPSNNVLWSHDFVAAQQQAVQSGKPMILFFTGEWCVPCRIMKRTVWADEQVAAIVNARFVCLAVDIDDSGEAAVLSRYKVVGTPVTIITDPQGNVLQIRDGGISKSDFLEMLGNVK